jgi:hypothetical protein
MLVLLLQGMRLIQAIQDIFIIHIALILCSGMVGIIMAIGAGVGMEDMEAVEVGVMLPTFMGVAVDSIEDIPQEVVVGVELLVVVIMVMVVVMEGIVNV